MKDIVSIGAIYSIKNGKNKNLSIQKTESTPPTSYMKLENESQSPSTKVSNFDRISVNRMKIRRYVKNQKSI